MIVYDNNFGKVILTLRWRRELSLEHWDFIYLAYDFNE